MFIQSNTGLALFGQRQVWQHGNRASEALQKLSSGNRINKFSDNMSDFSRSEAMRFQMDGLRETARAEDVRAKEYRVFEGALQEMHTMATNMADLAAQAADGTTTAAERARMQQEVEALAGEIGSTIEKTSAGGSSLRTVLDKMDTLEQVRMEHESTHADRAAFSAEAIRSLAGSIRVDTQEMALASAGAAKDLVDALGAARTAISGAAKLAERLGQSLEGALDTLTEAYSAQNDTDLAEEMAVYTKEVAMQQTSVLMTAHILREPEQVLSLLKSMAL